MSFLGDTLLRNRTENLSDFDGYLFYIYHALNYALVQLPFQYPSIY